MTDKPKRPAVDWEAVHREYRAGQLSVSEIARQHGCSEAAIRKKAKQLEWVRDLGNRVRQEVRAKLAREDGSAVGSNAGASASASSNLSREDESRTVELAAERGVIVVREHRTMLDRTRRLAMRMLDELEAVTTHAGQLAEMIEEATRDDKSPQRRNAMLRAIEVPGRIAALKDVSILEKNLVPLERQAFSLDDAKDDGESLGSLIVLSMTKGGAEPLGTIIEHEETRDA